MFHWQTKASKKPVGRARAVSQKTPSSAPASTTSVAAMAPPPVSVRAPVQQQTDDVSGSFEKGEDRQTQFHRDVDLWHKTLTAKGDGHLTAAEHRLHGQQQDIMKRHFLAMAMLGPQAGNQTTGVYRDLDEFGGSADPSTASEADHSDAHAPLAALASHGGRFAYETGDKALGQRFKNQLLFGSDEQAETQAARRHAGLNGVAQGSGSRASDSRARRKQAFHAGLFTRGSSHPQKFDAEKGRWMEKANVAGTQHTDDHQSLGMNIAFGGIGNTTKKADGTQTVIGPEGDIFRAQRRNGLLSGAMGNMRVPGFGSVGGRHSADQQPKTKLGQHGHAFFKYDAEGKSKAAPEGTARLMVGFEGSGPSMDSLHGSHGLMSMLPGLGNKRSITGQGKSKTVGLPAGKGALKTTLHSQDQLDEMKHVFGAMDKLKSHPEKESEALMLLLQAKTSAHRQAAIEHIKKQGELMDGHTT